MLLLSAFIDYFVLVEHEKNGICSVVKLAAECEKAETAARDEIEARKY